LSKFHEENVLLEQIFVVDQKSKIAKLLDLESKAAGAPIRVEGFVRFALGEGIERPPANTAA
jgi:elongation factor Ts